MISLSSGSSRRLREADEAPGCLPGLRPDLVRDDRFCAGFFAHGASEEWRASHFPDCGTNRFRAGKDLSLWPRSIGSILLSFVKRRRGWS